MNGVDVADQLRSYYEIGRRSIKWWKYVWFFILNVCLINAHILYNLVNPKKKLSLKDYRKMLTSHLINNFSMRQRDMQNGRVVPNPTHTLEKSSLRNCYLCKKKNILHANGNRI